MDKNKEYSFEYWGGNGNSSAMWYSLGSHNLDDDAAYQIIEELFPGWNWGEDRNGVGTLIYNQKNLLWELTLKGRSMANHETKYV